jgi:hypothetical protein
MQQHKTHSERMRIKSKVRYLPQVAELVKKVAPGHQKWWLVADEMLALIWASGSVPSLMLLIRL